MATANPSTAKAIKHGRSRATIDYPGHRQTLSTKCALPWPAAALELDRQNTATRQQHQQNTIAVDLSAFTRLFNPSQFPQCRANCPDPYLKGFEKAYESQNKTHLHGRQLHLTLLRVPKPWVHSLLRRTQTLTVEFFRRSLSSRSQFWRQQLIIIACQKISCDYKVSSWNVIRNRAAVSMIRTAEEKTRIRSKSKHRDSRCRLHRRSFTKYYADDSRNAMMTLA